MKPVRATPAQPVIPPRRPASFLLDESREATRSWWQPSIKQMLADAPVLLDAAGPRELEQATAELLGATLHRAISEQTTGFALLEWLTCLIDTAGRAGRSRAGSAGSRYLLHGITALAPRSIAPARLSRLGGPGTDDPEWLAATGTVTPTGEVYLLTDGYQTRFGVLVGCHRPSWDDGGEVFLLDVDACTPVIRPFDAGVYDSRDAAAQAWRDTVGQSAAGAELAEAEPALLAELLPFPTADPGVIGDESRRLMDNYFRILRRSDDLRAVLADAGTPLPTDTEWSRGLYCDVPVDPYLDAFTAWYTGRNGTAPDGQAIRWLIEEWTHGTIARTRLACSPHRIVDVRDRIALEWNDDPAAKAALALIPAWVHWCAEQTGLTPDLTGRAHSTATSPRTAPPADQA